MVDVDPASRKAAKPSLAGARPLNSGTAAVGVAAVVVDAPAASPAPPSPWRSFWYAFSENKGAVAGLILVAIVVLLALGADWVAPYSPTEQFRDAIRAAPAWAEGGSTRFLLGTDSLGRDMLSRLIHGARVSLFIGLSVMGVSFVIGVLLGLACASLGQVVDVVITRVMDLIMAVPSLVLAILVVAVLGPSLTNTIVAVTIVYLPRYVRLLRASALAELKKDYVTAARVSGVSGWRLMFHTVLPNCLAPLIVQAALGVSDAILEAAALGFLGLGAQPPIAEWGTMLADAREFIRSDPWLVTLPGLAILITVVSINLAGDGLRDALDPKMRKT
jgi:dipeptide transport system permease protein